MEKVDLSGVTTGSFNYLVDHFWGLAKVSLLPVLVMAACFAVSSYLGMLVSQNVADGSFNFASAWLGVIVGLVPSLSFTWLWVRVVNFVFGDGAVAFEVKANQLKSTLFAILYLMAALAPLMLLWFALIWIFFLVASAHVSGLVWPQILLFFVAMLVALWYTARVSVSLVQVARSRRPNLFTDFFQASAGNDWGLVGRCLCMGLLGVALEIAFGGLFFVIYGRDAIALLQGATVTELAAFQIDILRSGWPFFLFVGLSLWAFIVLQSVFSALLAERFPRLGS